MAQKLRTLGQRLPGIGSKSLPGISVTETQRMTSRPWARLRDRIMRRDGGICRCARCQASGDTKPAHEVDHITPLWMGGTDDESNLCAINHDCHQLKTADEAKQRAALGATAGGGVGRP